MKIHQTMHRICAFFCMNVTLQYQVKRKSVKGTVYSKAKHGVLGLTHFWVPRKGFPEEGLKKVLKERARGRGRAVPYKGEACL